MFEVLEWDMPAAQDNKAGCVIRVTPRTVVDLPTPFRVAWKQDGQMRIGFVLRVDRRLAPVPMKDLVPGDIVYLHMSKWGAESFAPQTLLYVRL